MTNSAENSSNIYRIQKGITDTDTELFLENLTDSVITLGEICVAAFPNTYNGSSRIYGEGFTMLSQYTGTLNEPRCMTKYDDFRHYKLNKSEGYNAVYNLLLIENNDNVDIFAFSSCRRFSGRIEWNSNEIRMILNLENISVKPRGRVQLENILVLHNVENGAAMALLSECLVRNHDVPQPSSDITGWCSWLCFGPDVTADDIDANILAIKRHIPELKYIQIDDGFQAHMGDWLTVSKDFGSMEDTLESIRKRGAEPAIWAAPFIADRSSALLAEHPEYFVQDSDGKPLASDRFTFGGWRCAPWYILDGSNPDACGYLEHVFRTMREKWGIKYFKLDANCWGAFSAGVRYDKNCTSVESYRLGMEAVRRGAGDDAVILGCNAPMWPSVGTVNSMRVSGDMCRQWKAVRMLGQEICARTWTHRLWCVDPDVITLKNQTIAQLMPDGTKAECLKDGLMENEIEYHKCAVFAAGGFVLAGDDLSRYDLADFDTLKIFLHEKHMPAVFSSLDFSVGYMSADGCSYAVVFNPDDSPCTKSVRCGQEALAYDVFAKHSIGKCNGSVELTIPPRSARLIKFISEE